MKLDQSEMPHFGNEFDGLPAFVVGGWARDWFRDGVRPNDVDLMVAEVTPQEMKERGFTSVSAAGFPVFLDSLGREVAIAREEVSTGDGHKDFDVTPVPASVEAEEAIERDLLRRDFTVNAIAFDRDGYLWDPHGGVDDLDRGIIRAVNDHGFVHDPLRILRGARFAGRLKADIEEDTKALMREMVDGLKELPGERIRRELVKNFKEAEWPAHFFRMLDEVGALETAFPELHALKGVPAGPDEYHNEKDAFDHTMLVIGAMNDRRENDELALLMSMVHDLGKASTPSSEWPNHYGHGDAGLPIVGRMNQRLRFSNQQVRAMRDAARLHMKLHSLSEMNASTVFDLVAETHEPDRLIDLALADKEGRLPPQYDLSLEELANRRFSAAKEAMREINGRTLMDRGRDPQELGGEKFGKMLRDARIAKMKQIEGNQ